MRRVGANAQTDRARSLRQAVFIVFELFTRHFQNVRVVDFLSIFRLLVCACSHPPTRASEVEDAFESDLIVFIFVR